MHLSFESHKDNLASVMIEQFRRACTAVSLHAHICTSRIYAYAHYLHFLQMLIFPNPAERILHGYRFHSDYQSFQCITAKG